MADIRPPLPVKLIVGILTSLPEILPEAEAHLTAAFGPIDARSELYPFEWTGYYNETMGAPILRRFLSFRELIAAEALAPAKIRTNELEALLAAAHGGVRRPINLDPGYLEQSKLVLASAKNFSHRILLAGGVYGEVTLQHRDGGWHSLPWTFPDYGSERYHPFFSSLRERYRTQLQEAGFSVRIPRRPPGGPAG
jgi:hypothetical protein